MPRKKTTATESSAAKRAKASAAKAATTTVPSSPVSSPSGLTPTSRQDSVAASLIQGAQSLQTTHSQVGSQSLPDLNTHAPTDYAQVSGDSPEMTKSEADQAIEQINNKINGQKVIQKNMELAQNVETSRQGLAKFLQAQVKAGTAMEGVSSDVAKHEAQVETTRVERERALQKALEAEGLESMRELVTQEAQQRHALHSAKIARLEQKTARLLNDDTGTVDAPEALPAEY